MSDNIITITDFMDPNLDVYARLTENQLLNRANPKEGMFIAESPKVIERALDAGCEPVSLLMETKHVNGEARGIIERCQNIPVYTASFDLLTKLTGFALTRGTLCAMYRPKPRSIEEVCRDARRVAVLEDVYDHVVTVELYDFLRPEKKFDSIEELKEQISRSEEHTSELQSP